MTVEPDAVPLAGRKVLVGVTGVRLNGHRAFSCAWLARRVVS